jgi:hypothetical protein
VKRAYLHRDELLPERTLEVETDCQVVRVVCDSPGIASVSHVLTLAEWDVLVASVREATA